MIVEEVEEFCKRMSSTNDERRSRGSIYLCATTSVLFADWGHLVYEHCEWDDSNSGQRTTLRGLSAVSTSAVQFSSCVRIFLGFVEDFSREKSTIEEPIVDPFDSSAGARSTDTANE